MPTCEFCGRQYIKSHKRCAQRNLIRERERGEREREQEERRRQEAARWATRQEEKRRAKDAYLQECAAARASIAPEIKLLLEDLGKRLAKQKEKFLEELEDVKDTIEDFQKEMRGYQKSGYDDWGR